MMLRRAIIIAGRRTAIGKVGGLHARRRLEDLAVPVIRAVLADAQLDADAVDEVIMGNAIGGGGNPARLAALAARLPESVPALTIDRQCASGLDAIIIGVRIIAAGGAEVVIAGGMESASTAPWRIAKPANLYTDLPYFFTQPAFVPPQYGDHGMIEAAENIAREYQISRERQDRFALESHRRAIKAVSAGHFEAEIVPLGSGGNEICDEGPRASLSMALLARMPPLLMAEDSITAGNSCQINDGAAALLIVSEQMHARLGFPPGLEFAGAASAGVEPRVLGLAAVSAARKLRRKIPFAFDEFSAIELNEAFAAQVLATADLLKIEAERLNTFGGALAYGHPYGASGALNVLRLFTQLVRKNTENVPKSGLAMIAAAGGVGTAAIFQKV